LNIAPQAGINKEVRILSPRPITKPFWPLN
jgi:hypothetical protein